MSGVTIHQEFPFAQIPNGVILHPDLTAHDKFIYMVIATHTKRDRSAFPGIRCLAEEAGCSTSTVQKAIQHLESVGALIVQRTVTEKGRRRVNHYELPMNIGVSREARQGVAGDDTPPVAGDATELYPSLTTPTEPDVSKPRTPQWQTLVELFGNPTPQLKFIHKRFSGMLERKGHSPDEIKIRAERLASAWGPETLTLPSLEKHWERWGVPLAGITKQQMVDNQRQRELADAMRSLE